MYPSGDLCSLSMAVGPHFESALGLLRQGKCRRLLLGWQGAVLGGEGLVHLGVTEPLCSASVTGTALPVAARSTG